MKTKRVGRFTLRRYSIADRTNGFDGQSKKRVLGYVFTGGKLAYRRYRRATQRLAYAIDHLPTGYRVQEFARRTRAIAFIRAVSVLDWDFTDPEKARPLSEKVHAAARAVGGE